jgi:hypothetical protein
LLQALIGLNLIHQCGTAPSEKLGNRLEVPIYEYTKGGIFLALVIKSMNITSELDITKKQETIAKLKKEPDKVRQDI